MNYPHASLTPDRIRTTFFDVPTLAIEFAYGPAGNRQFATQRKSIRDAGGDLALVAWPDGTMLELTREVANQELDVGDIEALYHLFHQARAMREAQGE